MGDFMKFITTDDDINEIIEFLETYADEHPDDFMAVDNLIQQLSDALPAENIETNEYFHQTLGASSSNLETIPEKTLLSFIGGK